MKIFEDVFTNDEVLSDALELKEDETGSIISVVSKYVVPDDGGNVDIGCSNHFGGNEEKTEDPNVEKVNNIVNGFCLEVFASSKKDMMSFLKDKIADVKKRLEGREDRLKEWGPTGSVSALIKKALSNFEETTFYMGKSYCDGNMDGMPIISFWADESDTGETFYYFKDALRTVKV